MGNEREGRMKTLFGFFIFARAQKFEVRRYNELVTMIKSVFPDFDEQKFFQYGCNCQFINYENDLPMSHPGYGAPVDELDKICKEYRSCVKCLKETHGNDCIPDKKRYNWKLVDGELRSNNDPGTCKRDLFECDKRMAIHLAQENYVYDENFHLFHSMNGFDYKEEFFCHPSSDVAKPSEPGCCQPTEKDTAFIRFNKLHKKCCADGSIQNECDQPVPTDEPVPTNP